MLSSQSSYSVLFGPSSPSSSDGEEATSRRRYSPPLEPVHQGEPRAAAAQHVPAPAAPRPPQPPLGLAPLFGYHGARPAQWRAAAAGPPPHERIAEVLALRDSGFFAVPPSLHPFVPRGMPQPEEDRLWLRPGLAHRIRPDILQALLTRIFVTLAPTMGPHRSFFLSLPAAHTDEVLAFLRGVPQNAMNLGIHIPGALPIHSDLDPRAVARGLGVLTSLASFTFIFSVDSFIRGCRWVTELDQAYQALHPHAAPCDLRATSETIWQLRHLP